MSRRAILVVVALVVAALSTALLTIYVRDADARADEGKDLVSVLVASEEIPAGQTGQQINDSGAVDVVSVPAEVANPDALSEITDTYKNQFTDAVIYPGEQINKNRFKRTANSRLGIDEGQIAVAIPLDDAARVAGYVEPGSEVAVFVTLDNDGASETRLLLKRVKVLATGTDQAGSENEGALLTVQVDQTQAQDLIYAQANGRLYIALLDPNTELATLPPTNAVTIVGAR